MSENLSHKPSPASEPAAVPATRTVRAFKNRSEAELAAAYLKEEGISAVILDLASSPGKTMMRPDAVRLVVDAEFADKAESLLLSHGRAQKEGRSKNEVELQRRERERNRYARERSLGPPPQRGRAGGSWVFVSLAIVGSFGAIAYMLGLFEKDSTPELREKLKPRLIWT
jgi:hypothetical protein